MQESSLFILNKECSVANHFLAEIRKTGFQNDRMRFRKNMERIGELLAYEISKSLVYEAEDITTPLDTIQIQLLKEQPVLISVLRAGIPFHQGLLNFFDHADSGFIGAFRQQQDEEHFSISLNYFTYPEINKRHVILMDPMLATGRTIVHAAENILQHGSPEMLHIAAAVTAPEGLEYLRQHCPCKFSLWTGALDKNLNNKSYIVPGLGDAGDLAFGSKL